MRRNHDPGMSPFRAGLIALIAVSVISYFGFTKSNPLASHYEISAAFRTANDIKPKSPVRIAGVNIGKVTRVEPTDDGRAAIVTMQIDDEGLPIHRDARMKIRPRIFLEGNYFVDVQPGSPSAPLLREGDVLPAQQTAAPVQNGQLLAALQSDTREDIKKLLRELGAGLANGGAAGYNRSIRYWEGAFRDSAIANEAALGRLEHDLSEYVESAGVVAGALDRDPAALQSLITDFAATAGAFASQEHRLTEAVGELPRTLGAGRGALAALDTSFPNVRGLIRELRPTVREARPTLKAQLPFLQQTHRLVTDAELGGLVREMSPVVPSMVELNRGGVGLQREARLLSSCQLEVVLPNAESRIPDTNFPPTGPVYENAIKWLPGAAGESRNFDANGAWIRTFPNTANYAYPLNDGRFFFTTLPIQGVNPPKAPGVPPMHNDVPCETQQRPDLRTRIGAPPQAIRIDQSSSAALARYARAKLAAVRWLRDDIARIGLGGRLRVAVKDLVAADIPRLARALPGGRR
jgi:virulence factor Mce-like protein